jgi:hypothetical protein
MYWGWQVRVERKIMLDCNKDMNVAEDWFLILGIFHGVQGKISRRRFGSRCGSRNVVGKLTLHAVQNPENQKSVFIPRWKSKINNSWRSSLFSDVTQRSVIVSYRRCGTTCRSRLQRSSSPANKETARSSRRDTRNIISLTAWPLTVGPIGCFETSVTASVRCVTSQKSGDLTSRRKPGNIFDVS